MGIEMVLEQDTSNKYEHRNDLGIGHKYGHRRRVLEQNSRNWS